MVRILGAVNSTRLSSRKQQKQTLRDEKINIYYIYEFVKCVSVMLGESVYNNIYIERDKINTGQKYFRTLAVFNPDH